MRSFRDNYSKYFQGYSRLDAEITSLTSLRIIESSSTYDTCVQLNIFPIYISN